MIEYCARPLNSIFKTTWTERARSRWPRTPLGKEHSYFTFYCTDPWYWSGLHVGTAVGHWFRRKNRRI